MRWPWKKVPAAQLDLLDEKFDAASQLLRSALTETARSTDESPKVSHRAPRATVGLPLCVPIGLIDEDPNNPRTEFVDADIDELADDVRQRGILQQLVVHPADAQGRHRLHFGAKRLNAALRAGLSEVPVVVRDAPADAYDEVAENQKRHALPPLDLARFIKGRVDAGESNSEIARRLGMNLTTVAHQLALLSLATSHTNGLRALPQCKSFCFVLLPCRCASHSTTPRPRPCGDHQGDDAQMTAPHCSRSRRCEARPGTLPKSIVGQRGRPCGTRS
jgi:ParB family chromosome partitioning protein